MCFFFLFFVVSRLLLLVFSMRNSREFSPAHFSVLFTFLRFYFLFSVCWRPHEMFSPFRRKIGIAYALKASQVVVYDGMSIVSTGERNSEVHDLSNPSRIFSFSSRIQININLGTDGYITIQARRVSTDDQVLGSRTHYWKHIFMKLLSRILKRNQRKLWSRIPKIVFSNLKLV